MRVPSDGVGLERDDRRGTLLNNFGGAACDVDQGTIAPFGKYRGACITFAYGVSFVDRWAHPSGGTSGWTARSVSSSER